MKYFGTQTNYLLDIIKPYQRPELRHAGPNDVNREAELKRLSRVACSDLLDIVILTASSWVEPKIRLLCYMAKPKKRQGRANTQGNMSAPTW